MICKKIGCDFEQSDAFGAKGLEAYILDCTECGRREILNVKDGEYNQRKYTELTKRSYIQPQDRRRWALLQEHEEIKRLRNKMP